MVANAFLNNRINGLFMFIPFGDGRIEAVVINVMPTIEAEAKDEDDKGIFIAK